MSFNKILTILIFIIIFIIVGGSIAAIATGKTVPGTAYRKADPASVTEIKDFDPGELSSFKEFGTLRALTKSTDESSRGTVIVITPWFSYHTTDSAFYEELFQKRRLMTSIFMTYFSSKTKNELLSLGEKRIKKELLEKINSELIMSKIQSIYFDDYMFLD